MNGQYVSQKQEEKNEEELIIEMNIDTQGVYYVQLILGEDVIGKTLLIE